MSSKSLAWTARLGFSSKFSHCYATPVLSQHLLLNDAPFYIGSGQMQPLSKSTALEAKSTSHLGVDADSAKIMYKVSDKVTVLFQCYTYFTYILSVDAAY